MPPLFTIPWDDPRPPLERIFDGQQYCERLLTSAPKPPTSALCTLEQISALMTAQAAGPIGSPSHLPWDALERHLNNASLVFVIWVMLLHRASTLLELKRLKRQFVASRRKAVTLGSTKKGRVESIEWEEEGIGYAFAELLEESGGVLCIM